MKDQLNEWARDRKKSQVVGYVILAVMIFCNSFLLVDSSREIRHTVLFGFLLLAVIWAVIRYFANRDAPAAELKARNRNLVYVVVICCLAFLAVQLLDVYYFRPKAQEIISRVRSQSER